MFLTKPLVILGFFGLVFPVLGSREVFKYWRVDFNGSLFSGTMLETSQATVYVHLYARHEPRRLPGVARCLFGRPDPSEVRKHLDDELAKNCKRFSSRYEVCQPESFQRAATSNRNLFNKDDTRRKRLDSIGSSPKRQKLLTGKCVNHRRTKANPSCTCPGKYLKHCHCIMCTNQVGSKRVISTSRLIYLFARRRSDIPSIRAAFPLLSHNSFDKHREDIDRDLDLRSSKNGRIWVQRGHLVTDCGP